MSATAENLQAQTSPSRDTLLFVDQDRKALTAVRRLLAPLGYRVLLASGGHEALVVLEKAEVDVLISGMRLPRMNGTQFLALAAERWPHVLRILLIQCSDMTAAARAIKEGRIYRYLSRPWNDEDLKLLIAQAVEHRHLLKDKLHLLVAIRKHRHELVRIKNDLETRVQERTSELLRAAELLRGDNEKLREKYSSAVQTAGRLLSQTLGPDEALALLEKEGSGCDPALVQAFLESVDDGSGENEVQQSEDETTASKEV